MSEKLVQLEEVTAGYQEKAVLHNLSWEIKSGEHWIISGKMSTGKTTLCKVLTGRSRILNGKINFPFLASQPYEAKYELIKMVSFTDDSKLFYGPNAMHYYQQRYHAFDSEGHLTVREYLQKGGFAENNTEHITLLSRMGILPYLDYERIKLSSGQTRKMLLAKVMFANPRILILDNPYIGLDASSRRYFNNLLDQLSADSHITFILSGHYHHLPECISHCMHLEAGKIKFAGRLQEFTNPENQDVLEETSAVLDKIRSIYHHNLHVPNFKKVIDFQDVSIRYGDSQILKNINWTIHPGEKWVLSGPNGSGKSTLLSLMYADHPQAYAQKIFIFDRRRGSGESIWEIKRRFGFSSSELHAYFKHDFTLEQVILSGFKDGFSYIKAETDVHHLLDSFLKYFGILTLKNSRFKELSTGMQRLSFFIRSLIKIPEVLLLDEPYQALDENTISKCNHLLRKILSEHHTLLFISHFQDEVPEIIQYRYSLDN